MQESKIVRLSRPVEVNLPVCNRVYTAAEVRDYLARVNNSPRCGRMTSLHGRDVSLVCLLGPLPLMLICQGLLLAAGDAVAVVPVNG